MKKSLKTLSVCAVLMLSAGTITLFGCGPDTTKDDNKLTVNFVTGYQDLNSTQSINKNLKVSNPNTSITWYKDKNFNNEFDFNTAISVNTTVYGKTLKGTGTQGDPYQISHELNLRYLVNFGSEVNKFAKLTNDITYNSVYSENYKNTIFAGTFDGNNKTITLNAEDVNDTGIFYKVTGTVKDLNIVGHIQVGLDVGICGVVANVNSGTLDNITTKGTSMHLNTSGSVSNGYANGIFSTLAEFIDEEKQVGLRSSALDGKTGAGGIAGVNDGTIQNCTNHMNVRAVVGGGGMCAVNNGLIKNCFNNGAIGTTGMNSATFDEKFDFSFLGGMAGINKGKISQCGNLNQIFAQRLPWLYTNDNQETNYHMNIGGITGDNIAVKDGQKFKGGIITECFNYGRIHGDLNVGGIAGQSNGFVANCASYCLAGARLNLGGIVGLQKDDDAGIVTNCSSMQRINSNSASNALIDGNGQEYTLTKLEDGTTTKNTNTIVNYYCLAKYATNSLYHNNSGNTAPIDPATQDVGSNATTTAAKLYNGYSVLNSGEGSGKWIKSDAENYDKGAIVVINASYQVFLNVKLAWQAKTITAVDLEDNKTTIDGNVGIDYINHVLTKNSSDKYTGFQNNNLSGVTNTEGFILPAISVPEGKKLVWTTKNDITTMWDGILKDNITVYAMIVEI